MIGRIQGKLIESNPPHIMVDVHGVGYEIDVPMSTFYNLPPVGHEVTLLTHFVVREDAQLLYGFLTAEERDTFRLLLKVSGIGARTALSILSGMSVADLVNAVVIGKKQVFAERIFKLISKHFRITVSDYVLIFVHNADKSVIFFF